MRDFVLGPIIVALAAFSLMLSIFLGVYQSRLTRRQLQAAEASGQ